MRHALPVSCCRPRPDGRGCAGLAGGPLLRDERGAATMHWITIGILLLFAALLAYPDLTYDLDRTLYRYGIDIYIPYLWN